MDKEQYLKLGLWILISAFVIIVSLLAARNMIRASKIKDEIASRIPYYPSETMTKIFKNEATNDGFTQIVELIQGNKIQIKQVDSLTRVIMVYEVSDENIKLVFTKEMVDTDSGKNFIEGLVPEKEDIIIQSPLEVGTQWFDGDGGKYEIIKTDAIVKIGLDTFETIVVKYTNRDFTVKEYYAKDIGLVKIIVNNYGVYELVQINKGQ